MSKDGTQCGAQGRGTPIEALQYSPGEFVVLTMARQYFSSFAVPHQQGWLQATATALSFFGDDKGPHAAMAVLAAVQAMRTARKSVFRFNAADCGACAAYVSAHERAFMNTVRATSAARSDAAQGHALLLCEGNDTLRFEHAVQTLVQVCGLSRVVQALPPQETRFVSTGRRQ